MARSAPSGAHRAKKRFGQHFLEPAWVVKMLRVIDPRPDETFLEIGPGRGALTFPLAAGAKKVIAFEIDRDLAAELRTTAPANVMVVEGDFLAVCSLDSRQWPTIDSLRAVGNLPYNVASPILFRLAELHAGGAPITDATVMLQREVAERLAAPPGSRDYGVLSVLIGHRATAKQLFTLPPGAFRPAPKVHSAVVNLRFHGPEPAVLDEKVFAAVVQAVFTRRRKTLANALLAYAGTGAGRRRDGGGTEEGRRRDAGGTQEGRGRDAGGTEVLPSPREALKAAGIDGSRRPETLTIAEFARLADAYSSDSR
jgi:16S rRNA (adenine1518-N6/adenine1519-N6)-dimethyltransferase